MNVACGQPLLDNKPNDIPPVGLFVCQPMSLDNITLYIHILSHILNAFIPVTDGHTICT